MNKVNELLLRIKYHDGNKMNWQDIADQIGMSTETLRKLRFEGFYDGLRWEQVQGLAKLLGIPPWELVRLVEENETNQ